MAACPRCSAGPDPFVGICPVSLLHGAEILLCQDTRSVGLEMEQTGQASRLPLGAAAAILIATTPACSPPVQTHGRKRGAPETR